ncbi:unnamed protein product [Discula destructiva]
MAFPTPHVDQAGGHPSHKPESNGNPAPYNDMPEEHDLLCARAASAAPSERSTHFDVFEHDFLSVREPTKAPSHSSVMGDNSKTAPGGLRQKKQAHRKLVLCFDGTGNKFHGDDSDSNILKIFRMLDRTAHDQYHYYQPGIGTYVVSSSLTHTSARSRLHSWFTKAKDSAIGSSFDQHVVGGYRFLMRFYSPGDAIYIFGFSRGAYIARFLAEMLDYVGLLSHGNEEMVAFAWKAFAQWQCRRSASADDVEGQREKRRMYKFLEDFRETFSRPVRRIQFLGLFDTVNSVPRFETAWMERSKFPYTARSSAKCIRHAVSIDERRAKFRQDLIYQSEEKKHHHHHDPTHVGHLMHEIHERYRHPKPGVSERAAPESKAEASKTGYRGRQSSKTHQLSVPVPEQAEAPAPYRQRSRSKSRATNRASKTAETESNCSEIAPYNDGESGDFESEADETKQDIDEVWFAGGHGDVGGGWPVEEGTKSTSHVPLVWMVRQAIQAGLAFDIEKVVAMGCSEALGAATSDSKSREDDVKVLVPDIRIDTSSPPVSPMGEEACNVTNNGFSSTDSKDQVPRSLFHEMMHEAHVARIHDSLSFDCGMSFMSVFSWKMMEYMPFRRMDLQSDGSWKPIRWPLPGGEVRDTPSNVRVHGSVIRRMQQDRSYRPGNLIVGGGGRGCRVAPDSYGMGDWDCVENQGDPVGEIWKKRSNGSLGHAKA